MSNTANDSGPRATVTECILLSLRQFLFNPLDRNGLTSIKVTFCYALAMISFMILSLCGIATAAIVTRDELEVFVTAIAYLGTGIMALLNHILFLSFRNNVRNLLNNINEKIYTYDFDENLIKVSFDNGLYSDRNIRKFTILLLALFYSNLFVAIIASLTARFVNGDLSAFLYPSWYPWTTGYIWKYLVVLIFQSIVGGYVCSQYSSDVVYIMLIYLEYRRQYRRMQEAIRTIPIRSVAAHTEQSSADVYHRQFARNMIQCINHHQALKSNFECFRPYFEIRFSLEFCQCIVTLSLTLYALVQALEDGNSLAVLALVFLTLQGLFLKCYVGEKFSELNDTVAEAIYDLPWYEQSMANRKLLHIFQSRSRSPFVLNGLKVIPAALVIFVKIIRMSYSMMNLLRASYSE